jgi:hypothetical protein
VRCSCAAVQIEPDDGSVRTKAGGRLSQQTERVRSQSVCVGDDKLSSQKEPIPTHGKRSHANAMGTPTTRQPHDTTMTTTATATFPWLTPRAPHPRQGEK